MTKITIAPDVKALLPDVLIDWLCQQADTDAFQTKHTQTITLSRGLLGGQDVQDIRYADTQRRVFGFPPIACTLQLSRRSHHYLIALAQ